MNCPHCTKPLENIITKERFDEVNEERKQALALHAHLAANTVEARRARDAGEVPIGAIVALDGDIIGQTIRIGRVPFTVLGVLGFSFKAILIKLAYAWHPVDAVTLLALRMLFSAPFFIAMAWWAGRRPAAGAPASAPAVAESATGPVLVATGGGLLVPPGDTEALAHPTGIPADPSTGRPQAVTQAQRDLARRGRVLLDHVLHTVGQHAQRDRRIGHLPGRAGMDGVGREQHAHAPVARQVQLVGFVLGPVAVVVEVAERVLERLCGEDRLRMEVDDNGALVDSVGYGATDSPAGLAAWILVHPGFAQWTYGADPDKSP